MPIALAFIVHRRPSMPKLTACLIAKNEEAYLARCLTSIRPLVDDIVLVDTGSSDATMDIARQFGAQVSEMAWPDDFSVARNAALDLAKGDWILSIDADETIAARDHRTIRRLIAKERADAISAAQRNYLLSGSIVGWQAGDGGYEEGKAFPGYLDVLCIRLFRNRPWLRWRHRVHEELESIDPARPRRLATSQLVIHHFGKVGDAAVLAAKDEAYLRIGRKKIEDAPDDPKAHYELGIQFSTVNRHEPALESFRRVQALHPGYSDVDLHVSNTLNSLGLYREALDALETARGTVPKAGAELAYLEGFIRAQLGERDAAKVAFTRAQSIRAFPAASLRLAEILRSEGRVPEAAEVLGAALRSTPGDLPLTLQMARVLAQAGRFSEAHDTIASLPDDADPQLVGLRGTIALGRGDLDTAVTQLQRSVDAAPSYESSRNLATALHARGDEADALAAAAVAVGLSPAGAPWTEQFDRLAAQRLSVRVERPASDRRLAVFFAMPHSVPFDGNTPRTRGLGGTESALVYLAEALAARGHHVVVFRTGDSPSRVNGVEYVAWQTLWSRCVAERPDVLVATRQWNLISRSRLAPLQIFWTGDAHQAYFDGLADETARGGIDLFMLQSNWQVEMFQQHYQLPSSRIVKTALGAATTAIGGDGTVDASVRRGPRLAYASTPYRGLDVLLDLFPRIRAKCPDAALDVFSSMQVYGVSAAKDRAEFESIYRKADQPGVTLVGSIAQPELAARLRDARVLAYPNHFAETFCIAAAEAQAAGCAVVTSGLGALPETVGQGGMCIAGNPKSRPYQDAFVEACVRLLQDDDHWLEMSRRAQANADARYSWPSIAAQWERLFDAALRGNPSPIARVAVHARAGRHALADRMLTSITSAFVALPDDTNPQPEALPGTVASGRGDLDTAVAPPRQSVDAASSCESARNLATTLDTRGDEEGALAAAAVAVGLSHADTQAVEQFDRLAGQRLSVRVERAPSDRLELFFAMPHSIPFDGNTPRTGGLGGSESALVYLAEALAAREHRVVVFRKGGSSSRVNGVEYVAWQTLWSRCVAERPDVLVATRHWNLIGRSRLAPLQIFWTGDAHDQSFLRSLADETARRDIDLFMLQSDWQVETFQQHYQLPSSRIVKTALGAATTAIGGHGTADASVRRGRRLAYASTPFRGLDVLLDLFPRIRAKCPDAALDVFSSMQVYGVSAADDRAQFESIYRKADQPGVTLVGSIPQRELAVRLRDARVLAYPNQFAETFCIAAAEAQAAGCAVITSALGALPETVGQGGMCIAGNPKSQDYQDAFVEACVRLLQDDDHWLEMSRRAQANANARYAWPSIAAQWERLFHAALRENPSPIARAAVHARDGRHALADRMLASITSAFAA